MEPGAGEGAGFSDKAFEDAGAVMAGQSATWAAADIVLKVNPPSLAEVGQMKPNATLISMMYAFSNPELVAACNERTVSAFALDAVPRISRAQKMDVLSSQANLAGYKAVIIGANEMGKIFPLLMRSEEHTSELQSLMRISYAVFCLKKKKTTS